MRAEKDARDWHCTIRLDDDIKDLPEFFRLFLESNDVTHAYAVAENDVGKKWHIHIGFTYYRSYKSDYKIWFTEPVEKITGLKRPALEFNYHRNILGLVGGYHSKSEECIVLFRKGFTDEQLAYGAAEYIRGCRKSRIRKWTDQQFTIHPAKWQSTLGAQMAELDIFDEAEATAELVKDGWAIPESCRSNLSRQYAEKYVETSRMQGMPSGTIDDQTEGGSVVGQDDIDVGML